MPKSDAAWWELDGNIFDDAVTDGDLTNPRLVAEAAWEQIKHWVATGYRPVITVVTTDGEQHNVDLEEEPDAADPDRPA